MGSRTRKVIVEIHGTSQDKADVLQGCLETMSPDDIGQAFRRLNPSRLCVISRKMHGTLYAMVDLA